MLTILIVAVFVLQATGCGTLLYPERRGQTQGKIDPGVAILDGVGLLIFIVPGLIAFAIDFSTGAIYLPPEKSGSGSENGEQARVIYVDPDSLDQQTIEIILTERTGTTVNLDREDVVVSEVRGPRDFLEQHDALVESGRIPG
jgi:hypothetical protein